MRAILLTLCLVGTWFAAGDDYRSDARLEKPVTLRLIMAPLSECMKVMSRATGVPLVVTPNVSDRKLTVVCRDRPAAEAMSMIAKTIFCEWPGESGGYRLEIPREVLTEESDMLRAEAEAIKFRTTLALRQMAAAADIPRDRWAGQKQAAQDRVTALERALDPKAADYEKRLNELESARFDLGKYEWMDWRSLAEATRNASGVADQLAAGQAIFASTEPGSGLTLPPTAIPTIVPHFSAGDSGQVTDSPAFHGAFASLRLNPRTGTLEYRLGGTGNTSVTVVQSTSRPLPSSREADSLIESQLLMKRMRNWTRVFDSEILQRKVSDRSRETPNVYAGRVYTMAEQLEHLSGAADLPIVADAFRVEASPQLYMTGNTVDETVKLLREETSSGVRNGYFRMEKGWLMFRHPRFWRRLPVEIPEARFSVLEGAKNLGFTDYVRFASSLTPPQVEAFRVSPPVFRVSGQPLDHIDGLRLWGALSQSQQDQAYSSGVSFSSLSSDQRDLYRVAASELMWKSSPSSAGKFSTLLGGQSDPIFFVRDWKNASTATQVTDENRRSITLGFGAPDSGIYYRVVIPVRE